MALNIRPCSLNITSRTINTKQLLKRLKMYMSKLQKMSPSDAILFVIPSAEIRPFHQSNFVHRKPTSGEETVQPIIDPLLRDMTRLVSYISAKAAIDGNKIVVNLSIPLDEATAEELHKLCPNRDVKDFWLL